MARSTDRRGRELRHQEPAGPYRAQSLGRRGSFDIGVGAAVSEGRKGTQGCGERRLQVVSVGWPQIPTWNATDTPDMETSQLRYDDGASGPHSSIAGKSQYGRWVAGLAAAGLDTRLHMWQEGSGGKSDDREPAMRFE